jgi:2,5-diketo-D-gluconate reductase A
VLTPAVPTLALRNGAHIPALGLGTWPLSDDEAEAAVATAVDAGYRLVDTAYSYHNEVGVGRGLRASGVPREELFVTTKLDAPWHGFDGVREAFEGSVGRLGVDYLDLFLIHWPNPGQDRYVDAFRGLAKLLADGRVRAIGGSNFKPAHLRRVLNETGIVPDVNQIELNPTVTRDATRAYDAEHGIVTESWGPIGRGGDLLARPVITEIAERHGRTPAQVVLRWHVQSGCVPVPKSANPERLRANLDVFDFALTPAEVAAIGSLDRGESAALDSDSFGH